MTLKTHDCLLHNIDGLRCLLWNHSDRFVLRAALTLLARLLHNPDMLKLDRPENVTTVYNCDIDSDLE